MTIELQPIWVIFISIMNVVGPLFALVAGLLAVGMMGSFVVSVFEQLYRSLELTWFRGKNVSIERSELDIPHRRGVRVRR